MCGNTFEMSTCRGMATEELDLPVTEAAVRSCCRFRGRWGLGLKSPLAMERSLLAGFTLGRVVAVMLLCSCGIPATSAQSQTDFLNIDCGATERYVDPGTGLNWVPDDSYITTGKIRSNVALPEGLQNFTEMKSLRYFDNFRPNDLQTKYCYALPVVANSTYMLKATFYYGNYDNARTPPWFQLAIDASIVDNITALPETGLYGEFQYVAQGNVTFFCLIRTSPKSTPFISGISLKPVGLLVAGYAKAFNEFLQQGIIFSTLARVNYGGQEVIRFPTDFYDRLWFPESKNFVYYLKPTTSPLEFISTNSTFPRFVGAAFGPPSAVLQTAVMSSGVLTSLLLPDDLPEESPVYVSVICAELVSSGTPTPRHFTFQLLDVSVEFNISGVFQNFVARDFWTGSINVGRNSTITMTPSNISSGGPILNSMEVFGRLAPQASKTIDRDALAIEAIKLSLNLTEWAGDPCFPNPHSWVTCRSELETSPMPQIVAVDLSGYGLEGVLPPSFANLTALTSLHLENNKLSGPIPDWLTSLIQLRTLSIQNNNFSGPIPAALLSPNNSLSFTYYPGNPFLSPGPPLLSSKSNVAVIAGASIGGVLGLTLISLAAFFAFRRCQRRRQPGSNDDSNSTIRRISTRPGGATAYTLAEVTSATKNFDTEIGKGGFGPVYYGKLPDGQEVAVKVADGSTREGKREFFNEVDVLSTVHHKSLVQLVGYCQEKKKQILMYEYMHEGSLFDHLHGKSVSTVGTLDWKTRLRIALNAAQGLEYLHTGCSPSFIHRDVKSSNILLTSNYNAKVADFGLTRLMGEAEGTRVMTLVMGTAGYLDPEYYITNQVSSKSDVFSFGVVLLELLTGRLPIDNSEAVEMQRNITNWVRERLQNNDIDSILDPTVQASNPNMEAVWRVADVAMRSVEPKGVHRPTMSEVVQELRAAVTMEGHGHIMPSGYSDLSSGSQLPIESNPGPR